VAADDRRDFCLFLDHRPQAPAVARPAARPVPAPWGPDEQQVYDALLVISELVTNAVTHALPRSCCTCERLPTRTAGCRSTSVTAGPRPAPSGGAASRPAHEHGRGTAIVSALTAGTGAEGLIDRWADFGAA
jgi:hypothetical protein